jgi:hypothetical protein
MTRELVDRMRTCAATLEASQASGNPWDLALLGKDAARLLRIAADALDTPEPLGEPMPVISNNSPPRLPPDVPATTWGVGKPVWGGPLHQVAPCPACGSVDARSAKRTGAHRLRLTCPVCSHQWDYGA